MSSSTTAIRPFTVRRATDRPVPSSAQPRLGLRVDVPNMGVQVQQAKDRRLAANKSFYPTQKPEHRSGIQLSLAEEHLSLKYLLAEGALYQRRRRSSRLQKHLLSRIPAAVRRTMVSVEEEHHSVTGIHDAVIKALMRDIESVFTFAVAQAQRLCPRRRSKFSKNIRRAAVAAARVSSPGGSSSDDEELYSSPPKPEAKVAALNSVAALPLWKC